MLKGNILITGGAGFAGRAILRAAKRNGWDARFTIYSRDEEKQFNVRQRYPDVRCVLGDIRNLERLMLAMQGHDTVIHLSAVKFVPEAEFNVFETIEVNVNGSMNVAAAAHACGVNTVIGVSTDKASSPVNLYGVTKMTMERVFGEANKWGKTRFMVTRYGNVVGSTGSIVPVFREMFLREGRVKVTDPNMTRFWLSADEAVSLIVDCADPAVIAECAGGILVPSPGAMKIGDLAETIVGMYHKRPNPQVVSELGFIDYIGARPGEKTHESLISEYEAARSMYFHVGGRLSTRYLIAAPGTFTKQRLSDSPHAVTSDEARFWYDPEAMRYMIEDAETI